jgi:hypothetical protein
MRYTRLLLAAILFAPPAHAQDFEPFGVEVRPFVGLYMPTGRQHGDFRNAVMIGLQSGFEFNAYFHVVGSTGWTHGRSQHGALSADVTDLWHYDLGAELGPLVELSPITFVRLFAGAGGGMRTYDYRSPLIGMKTCTAAYGALGTALQQDMVAVRLEGRGYGSCYEPPITGNRRTRWDLAALLGFTIHFR